MNYQSLKRSEFVIFFIVIHAFTNTYAQISKYQIIDSKSKESVPFAYINVIGKNIHEKTDQDGCFSIALLNNDSIQISHLAYKTIKISYYKLKHEKIIELEELPVELNPIIISPEYAKTIVDRAVDSSFSSLYTPMFYKCYRRDWLIYCDTLVAGAAAEIMFILKFLSSPSHGGIIKNYLENIKVYRNPLFKQKLIPRFSLPAPFAPINMFLVGSSKETEKLLYFTFQEEKDSVYIVSFNPRLDYKPRKKYLLKSGRVIINKVNGKILRIEAFLDPGMMINSRLAENRPKNAQRYYYQYSYFQFFDKNGTLSRVDWNYKFSFPENDPKKLWENHSELIFIKEDKEPVFKAESFSLKEDTTLVQMNSKYNSDFEKKINMYFPNNLNTAN
jgi:hypothetical protein